MNYTFYDYLELAPGAPPDRIESAYVALLERFGYGTTDAGQDMSGLVRMIHSAYEVLADPETRTLYDAKLAQESAMADAELKSSLDELASEARRNAQNPPPTLRSVVRAVAA